MRQCFDVLMCAWRVKREKQKQARAKEKKGTALIGATPYETTTMTNVLCWVNNMRLLLVLSVAFRLGSMRVCVIYLSGDICSQWPYVACTHTRTHLLNTHIHIYGCRARNAHCIFGISSGLWRLVYRVTLCDRTNRIKNTKQKRETRRPSNEKIDETGKCACWIKKKISSNWHH